ncbi:MAG TPA: DUF1294 domain-containing protein [Opitutus sp.]|nr:DUF1294 domain-containing protein [Opitutus sp.]
MRTHTTPTARRFQRGGGINGAALIVLLHLLVLPGFALMQVLTWIDWRLLAGGLLMLSLVTFLAYRSDKRRAEAGQWRIPESMLHFAELIGGWPGAFLGQRSFRHKTSKVSYQLVFWSIVLIHQLVALDCLLDWRFSRDALYFLQNYGA